MPLEIPVIDISAYISDPSAAASKASIAAQIHSAATSPGFFQITGHGIPVSLQTLVLEHMARFFALPQPAKDAVLRSKSPCHRGYETVGEQHLEAGFQDMKEGFTMGAERDLGGYLQGPNMWPAEEQAPGLRAAMELYIEKMRGLSVVMFRLVALSLDLEETYFDEFAGSRDSIRLCRAHRYPPTTPEAAAKSRGIGAHTDFGALTLLLQDNVGGLEVFHRPNSTWHPVMAVENAYVVNIGDMLARWTNDRYTSTLHRVISPVSDKYRYSIAYFNEGPADQVIECISTCLGKDGRALYEPVTVEQHLKNRYASSY